MLKYLVIDLCDTSVSYCHYGNPCTAPRLIDPETLKRAIFAAMKENLNIQFVYPSYTLPDILKAVIDTIDHTDIVPAGCDDRKLVEDAGIVVFDGWEETDGFTFRPGQAYVIRTDMDTLTANGDTLRHIIAKADRINVVVTDLDTLTDAQLEAYPAFLAGLIPAVTAEYERGHAVQLNLLTDRMLLDGMNNCNAGDESIALAPDGKLYVCPAFMHDGSQPVGTLGTWADGELDIKNRQLYRLDHAPICRKCDAWHCRRCVWLNRRSTLEVNTPGREQCVSAHHERNASRVLLASIRTLGTFLPDREIPEISYLDPFEIAKQ